MGNVTAIFVLRVLGVSVVVGALTPLLFTGGYETLLHVVVAGLTGAFIGGGCLTVELTVLSNRALRWLRQIPLIAIIAFRAASYSLIIIAGIVLPALVILGVRLWQEPDFGFNFAVSAAIAFAISTSVELLRLLGREATIAIFTGHYRRPRQEHRIVLVADLVGSTALAERLGDLSFHEFMSDVSYDVSPAIERTGGEVHRYVGDAVFVTWPAAAAENYAKSVACARDIPKILAGQADAYRARYGQEARIRVALHCGPVAAGEIGTWKKEIALLGDTMNTAARIETAARELGVDVVISDVVKAQLSPEHQAELVRLPDYTVRGKQTSVKLWTVAPGAAP